MSRGRRLFFQFVLLVGMLALSIYDDDTFVVVVSLILIPLPAFNGTVAAVLIWTAWQAPEIESLRNRADDAITLTMASLAGAVAGAISLLRVAGVDVPGRPALGLLGFCLIMISVPALGWLAVWRDVWMPKVREKRT